MEKTIFELIDTVFRILLRCWAKGSKNNELLITNFTDIMQFAEKCGLEYLDAKKFNRTIEDFVDKIASDFIKEFGTQIKEEERKKTILYQIQQDIKKINLNEQMVLSLSNNSNSLQALIMNQSKQERAYWDSAEIGIYTNCVKYISKI